MFSLGGDFVVSGFGGWVFFLLVSVRIKVLNGYKRCLRLMLVRI